MEHFSVIQALKAYQRDWEKGNEKIKIFFSHWEMRNWLESLNALSSAKSVHNWSRLSLYANLTSGSLFKESRKKRNKIQFLDLCSGEMVFFIQFLLHSSHFLMKLSISKREEVFFILWPFIISFDRAKNEISLISSSPFKHLVPSKET